MELDKRIQYIFDDKWVYRSEHAKDRIKMTVDDISFPWNTINVIFVHQLNTKVAFFVITLFLLNILFIEIRKISLLNKRMFNEIVKDFLLLIVIKIIIKSNKYILQTKKENN